MKDDDMSSAARPLGGIEGTDQLTLEACLPACVTAFVTRRPLLAVRLIEALAQQPEDVLRQILSQLESGR